MNGEVLHDYFAQKEGGGRLALTLGASWDWPVTGGFVNRATAVHEDWSTITLRELGVRPGFRPRQSISLARVWSRYRSQARTIVYSGTYAPLAVYNHESALNILYCHSPPRFIYDQRSYYLASIPAWQRPLFMGLMRYLKPRYEQAVARMDHIIVNSSNVRRRVAQYLGRDSTVVHPPCDIERYTWREPEGFYLSTARLDVLKRVGLVVEAFKRIPDQKLVLVSDGPERRRLEALAAGCPNISFAGEVGDPDLADLIGRCIATIYVPRDEDFGMSPVESMAAGKPVIGVAEGGLLETVVDGETGILAPVEPQVEHLVEAVQKLPAHRARQMRPACEKRARLFSTEKFLSGMWDVVNGGDTSRPQAGSSAVPDGG